MRMVVKGLLAAVVATMLVPAGGVVPSYADDGTTTGDGDEARMLLLLDSSGSMKEKATGGTKIAAARTALLNVIDGLPADAEVGMRVFGSKVFSRTDAGACDDTELVVPVATDNRSELSAAVPAYKPYGETPIPAALKAAAEDLGDTGTRSILLVSDGESTCGDPCPVAKQISRSGVDLTINVVGLAVSGAARTQLKCLADSSGGTYYDADSAAEIESTLEHVATRSLRPFTYEGTAIVGGPEDSPTPITAGDWVDSLGGGGAKKSYSYELSDEKKSARFVFYLQDEHRTSAAMYVRAYKPDGTACAYQTPMSQRTFDVRDVMSAQVRIGALGDTCSGAGTYRLEVYRDDAATTEVPIGLRLIEEPAVDDPGWVAPDLEASAEPVSAAGSTTPLTGAQSFLSAPLLTPGSYASTIVAGESDLVRVHLDYGQSLRVGVEFPAITAAMEKALDGSTIWDSQARLVIYDPSWTQLTPASDAQNNELTGIDVSQRPTATQLYDATPAVSSVADSEYSFTGGSVARSGDYYVGLSMAAADNSVEFPFTMTIAVDGSVEQGPTFADDGSASTSAPSSSSASNSPSASSSASSSGVESNDDDGGLPAPVLIGVAAVIAAALAGGGWWWRRRRGSGTP
ncbi:vWA domain-containing protein [Nocardioides sp.]|uniref:vWA domain-containing protein n=1 Tax=Nocardioides sp. TaxID=35761 RepID=UPI0039E3C6E9